MARRRAPTEAERALWGAAMRDVKPLDPTAVLPVFPPLPTIAEPSEIATAPRLPAASIRRSAPGGVDRATVERLKRGQVNVEARIDLHGLDQRAAFAALMGFIETSSRIGRRSILVITGKGAIGEGVLRRNLSGWLMASPFAGRILTIQQAHTRHGGDGAFYVVLRRKRLGPNP